MAVNEGLVIDGLNVTDDVTYLLAELNVAPAKKRPEWITGADSDGAELAQEPRYEPRIVSGRILVVPQASMNAALDAVNALTDKLQEASRGGVDLLWTPANSTRSGTLKVLMGEFENVPISVDGSDAGWFVNSPPIPFVLTCRPFIYGAERGNIVDAFSIDSIGAYTFDSGSGSLSVTGGQLVPSNTATKRFHRSAEPWRQTGFWATFKVTTGTSVASFRLDIAKRLGATDYVGLLYNHASGLTIRKCVGGTLTLLASGEAPSLSASTSYWLRARFERDTITVERFTAAPTPTSTPAATVTYTLTGADATMFGGGVAGDVGIEFTPAGVDWRLDDLLIEPNKTRSALPLAELEIANVAGDVDAEARLIATDGAGQVRRYFRWGRESRYYPTSGTPPPLIIDSSAMVTAGFAGTTDSRTGAYNGASNNVITLGLRPQIQAICGLGDLTHVGAFRPQLRIHCAATTIAVRLTYQTLDGPAISLPFKVPVVTGWNDIDLGLVTIPAATLGGQRWTGQIEAYTLTPVGVGPDVDVVNLMPAEAFMLARASYTGGTSVLVAHDDFDGRSTSSALGGTGAPAGGTWTTAGATTDFSVPATDPTGMVDPVSRATTSDSALRTAVLGTTDHTNCEVSIQFTATAYPEVAHGVGVYHGVFARWVNSTTNLKVQVVVYKQDAVSPVRTLLSVVRDSSIGLAGSAALDPLTAGMIHELRVTVFASGSGIARLSTLDGVTLTEVAFAHAALAAGGPIATGRPGFFDANFSAAASTRTYDNFAVGLPGAEPVVINPGRWIESNSNDTVRQDAAGVYVGPPAEAIGARFTLPPAGTRNRRARVAAMARRNNIDTTADDHIADALELQAIWTPRYLNVPR